MQGLRRASGVTYRNVRTDKGAARGQRAFFYACPRARVDLCRNSLEVPMETADAAALEIVADEVLSPDVIELAIERLMRMFDAPVENVNARRKRLLDAGRKVGPGQRDGGGLVEAQPRPGHQDLQRGFVAGVAGQQVGQPVRPRIHRAAHRHAVVLPAPAAFVLQLGLQAGLDDRDRHGLPAASPAIWW